MHTQWLRPVPQTTFSHCALEMSQRSTGRATKHGAGIELNSGGRHRRSSLPRKTALVAVALLVIGLIFGVTSLAVGLEKGIMEAVPFLVLFGVSFTPGSYACVILLRAYLGHPGYTYDMVPSYDN